MNKSYLTTYVTYWKSKWKARSEIYQQLFPNITTHRGRTGLYIRNKIASTTRLGKLCQTSVPFLRIVPVMDCALPMLHKHSRNKNDPLWFHGKVVRQESVTTERNWLKKLIESRNTTPTFQNNDAVQSGWNKVPNKTIKGAAVNRFRKGLKNCSNSVKRDGNICIYIYKECSAQEATR
jgi:hypothetical protein